MPQQLLLRHLAMPKRVTATRGFVEWVAARLRENTSVNIKLPYRVNETAW